MFETERLIVRPFEPGDYKDYHAYASRQEIYRFERGTPVDLKQAKKDCKRMAKEKKIWAAVLKENNKVIGQVSFSSIRPEEFSTFNLGYIFNPDYYGRGYATEAARGMVKYGFEVLLVHRIVGHCSPDNIASWKILERCDMTKEGVSRKDFPHHIDGNGKTVWLDSLEYAILEEDYFRK